MTLWDDGRVDGARIAFRHAMLFDSAEVSGVLAVTNSHWLPSQGFDPPHPEGLWAGHRSVYA